METSETMIGGATYNKDTYIGYLKLKKGGVAKMHKGGKTNDDMMSMGRGMAKVANQKTGMKG